VFELLPGLQQAQQSAILRRHSASLSRHLGTSALLLEMLNLVISNIDQGAVKFSRTIAVGPDVNSLLDIARKAFGECVNQLELYVAELEKELELPLKIESVVKDQEVKDMMREIVTMSNSVLDELLVEVREHIGFLNQLSETLTWCWPPCPWRPASSGPS
jgi:hypothetical protein